MFNNYNKQSTFLSILTLFTGLLPFIVVVIKYLLENKIKIKI